jgi:branched-chain amino acid transport system substrate-binding protein
MPFQSRVLSRTCSTSMRITTIALWSVCVACRKAPDPVTIGVPVLLGHPSIVDVAQNILDSTRGSSPPIRIVLDAGGPIPVQDSLTSLAAAVVIAGRMVALPGVVGVVGHAGSRDALIAAPVYNTAGVPQIVPTGTSRKLAQAGPWTFMLAPNDSIEGEFIARFAAEQLHSRNATVFFLTDEYGNGLHLGVVKALRDRGINILDEVPLPHDEPCSPPANSEQSSDRVQAGLRRGIPDLVILATRNPESACIISALPAHAGIRIIAGDGTLATPEFSIQAGPKADALYVATFWHPAMMDERSREFSRRFERTVGHPPHHGDALAYDGIMVLASAVRAVGADRAAIRDYLTSLGRTRPAFPGVTGPITFPATGNRLRMMRSAGGKWLLLESRDVTSSETQTHLQNPDG